MNGRALLALLVPAAALAVAVPAGARKPAEEPANPENIAAALRLTRAAAAEYEIRVGEDEKPLDLQKEPVLQWSNPDRGEVHGNVFLWTRDGRPLVVGSLFKWFSPHTHMSHEFQSFAEGPLSAKFHGEPKWAVTEPGLRFADLPGAPAPAATDNQRTLQLRTLARDFSGSKREREDTRDVELRLLPQPIHRYAVPAKGIHAGGLFTLVHGTDPEIFVLIEARGKDAATARWQFAAARMNSVEMRLRHKDKQVWSVETLAWKDVQDHKHPYTTFGFKEIPEFLKPALDKPKP